MSESENRNRRQYHRLDEDTIGIVSEIEDATEVPAIRRERERTNPFDDAVWASYNEGGEPRWKSAIVKDAESATRAIRNAANHCNLGVSIRKEEVEPASDGTPLYRVVFCGKEKQRSAA